MIKSTDHLQNELERQVSSQVIRALLLHFFDLSHIDLTSLDVTYSDVQYRACGNTGRLTVLVRSQAGEFEELMPQSGVMLEKGTS